MHFQDGGVEIMKRVLTSFFVSTLLALAMVSLFALEAYAQTGVYTGTDILGQGSNSPSAKVVNYGGRSWYVVGYNGAGSASAQGEIVLFMKGIETNAPYNNNLDLTYKGCTLQTTIDNFVNDNFSAEEKEAIIPKTLKGMNVDAYDDWWWYDNFHTVDDVPFEGVTVLAWPLGANEARTVNQELRKADHEYWLRSLGTVGYVDWSDLLEVSDLMAIVSANGDVDVQWDNENITWWKGVRPGFKMKMDSVLMTTLTSTGEYKLTLKDEARKNFSVDNCDNSINASGNLVVKYQNAVAGDNEYISYIIKGSDGSIKSYKRCDKVSSASGTATLTGLPKDASGKISLGAGDKLYVFNEQVNGDKKSNLASELIELSTTPGHDWDFWYFNYQIYDGKKTALAGYKCQINPMHIQYVEAEIETDGGTATCEDYIAVNQTVSISADKALDGVARQKTEKSWLMPLGHDWEEPTYEWSADNKTVTAKRVCKRDPSHIETETVSTTKSITESPTCSATGKATYTSNAFANSAFTVQTKTGVEVPVDPEAHDWDEGVDVEAQNICGGHGTLYTCTLCSATKIESKGGHDWEEGWTIFSEPTCEEYGQRHHKCKNCEALNLEEFELIDPLRHAWDGGVITKKATCTEDGVKTFTCAHDASHIKTEVIEKTGHIEADPVRENVAPASCETEGSYDEVVYCATCNAELSREKKTVDALGHDWSEWTRTKEPTCTESTTEERVCSHNAKHKENRVVDALGHDWGEWVVTKERSETEEGIETRTCNHDSSHTETRTIPIIRPKEISYRNTEGNGTQWTKGSGKTADFTFVRSDSDGETFSHFIGIQVDGVDVAATNYTAEPGSVIVKLKPAYLETLSAGEHTLTALFDDGNNVTVNFKVLVPSPASDDKKSNTSPTAAPTAAKTTANTSDSTHVGAYVTVLGVSLIMLCLLYATRTRRKE